MSSMKEGLPLGKGLVQSAEASMVFSSSRHQDPKGFPESDVGKVRRFGFLDYRSHPKRTSQQTFLPSQILLAVKRMHPVF